MRTSMRGALLATLATVVVMAGCGSGDESNGVGGADTNGEWERIAQVAPDEPDGTGLMVTAFDLAAAADHHDIDRPEPDASVDDVAAFVMALADADAFTFPSDVRGVGGTHGGMGGWVEALRDTFGIDPAMVTRWVEWSEPPNDALIVQGDFDRDTIDAALRSDNWPDELTEPEHRGVTYYSWRDDFDADPRAGTDFNRLGTSTRIALLDDLFVLTRGTEMMERIIDRHLHDETVDPPGLGTLLDRVLDDETWGTQMFSAGVLDSASLLTWTRAPSEADQDQSRTGDIILTPTPGTPTDELMAEVETLVDEATSTGGLEALADATSIVSDDRTVTIRTDGAAIDPDITPDTADSPMVEMGPAEALWRMLIDHVLQGEDGPEPGALTP